MFKQLRKLGGWDKKVQRKDPLWDANNMPDEVVCSFPKSGRTWLRVMLDKLGLELPYTHEDAAHNAGKHFQDISFDKRAFQHSRVLLLVRDPRDVVASSFFQTTKRTKVFSGTMSDFIRDPRYGIRKYLTYLDSWEKNLQSPKDLLWVSYEEMTHDTSATLGKILAFFGRENTSRELVEKTVEFAHFSNMQKMERSGELSKVYGKKLLPRDPDDLATYKAREGKIGGYKKHMSQADIAFCEMEMKNSNSLFYPVREEN